MTDVISNDQAMTLIDRLASRGVPVIGQGIPQWQAWKIRAACLWLNALDVGDGAEDFEDFMAEAEEQRHCRMCGCTDWDCCEIAEGGQACHWVELDLCSACRDGNNDWIRRLAL